MIKVLGRKTSGNVQKVLWLLEELGEAYVQEDYGRQFGNTQTPGYLALNPTAKVPTLVDSDLAIWESNTILRYLAAKSGNRFYSADLGMRTLIERWMDWQLAALNGSYLFMFRESKKTSAERSPDFATQEGDFTTQLKILDGALSGRSWLAGDALTIADMALGTITQRCLAFPLDLPALPNLRDWQARIDARPAFAKAIS